MIVRCLSFVCNLALITTRMRQKKWMVCCLYVRDLWRSIAACRKSHAQPYHHLEQSCIEIAHTKGRVSMTEHEFILTDPTFIP